MKRGEQKPPSFDRLLQNLKKYCAWRERCSQEAAQKLQLLNANREQTKQILQLLTDEGFLNNERFARMFAQGKLHNNKWGRQRIRLELKKRNIPDPDIKHAIASIDEHEYIQILKQLLHTKQQQFINKQDPFAKEKTIRYCMQKGFEPEMIWQIMDQHD